MPLTLSHPAVVLPLRRLGVPITALVIGTMVPDVPLFVEWTWAYDITHSIPGLVTVDVLAGVLLLVLWVVVVRDALVDLAPSAVRSRLPARLVLPRRTWLLAPLATCLGSATHLVWDSFTHAGRWGHRHVGWLRAEHLGTAGYQWAQYVSGVVGLVVVTWAACSYVRALAPDAPRPPAALSPAYLAGAVGTGVAAGLVAAALAVPAGVHAMAFDAAIASLLVGPVALLVVCCAWQVAVRRSRVGRA